MNEANTAPLTIDFEPSPTVSAIYLDYTGLFDFLSRHRHPAGQPRVQIELFSAASTSEHLTPVHACVYRLDLRQWVQIDPQRMQTLVNLTKTASASDDDKWQKAWTALNATLIAENICHFPDHAVLVSLSGVVFEFGGYAAAIRMAKAKYGLRFVPMIYDLVPNIIPQHSIDGLQPIFNCWLSQMLMHADLCAVISKHTGRDLADKSRLVKPLGAPPVLMKLDASMIDTSICQSPGEIFQNNGLVPGNYVLFVGTLESRKDHKTVFEAWLRLVRDPSAGGVPLLVCVGRRAWKFETAQAVLDAESEYRHKIIILSDVADADLTSLYQNCLFTVYASHYEGWGLPVTESLCYGKACFTANNSSLPEAGGPFADYYETGSVDSFVSNIKPLLFDSEYRKMREQLIKNQYRPRTWQALFDQFIHDLKNGFAELSVRQEMGAEIRPGQVYHINKQRYSENLSLDATIAEMLCYDQDWHEVGNDMVWSRRTPARLAFQIPESFTADIMLYVGLRGPAEAVKLAVMIEDALIAQTNLDPETSRLIRVVIPFHALQAAQEKSHLIILTFDLLNLNERQRRELGVGIEYFMACREDDILSRLEYLEHRLLQ